MSSTSRRRRPRWRRRARIAAVLLVGLLALLVAFAGPLLRPRVESAIAEATGLDARLDSLSLSLSRFEARLEGLSLSEGGRVFAKLESATVRLVPGSLLSQGPVVDELLLEGLDVDLSSGGPSLPASGAGPGPAEAPVLVRRIELRDARLNLPRIPEPLRLRARGALEPEGPVLQEMLVDAASLGTGVLSGRARVFGVEDAELDLEARFEGEAERWSELFGEAWPVRLQGPASLALQVSGPTARLALSGRVELAAVSSDAGLRVEDLRVQPSLKREAGSWVLDGDWQARRLALRPAPAQAPLPVNDLRGRLRATSAGGRVELAGAEVSGGDLAGEASWTDDALQATLSLQGVRLEGLPLPAPAPPLAGEIVAAQLDWQAPRAEPGRGSLSFRLDTRPPSTPRPRRLGLESRLVGAWSDGGLRLEPSHAAAAGVRVALEGRLQAGNDSALRVSLRAPSLQRSLGELAEHEARLAEAARRVTGGLAFRGTLSGSLSAPVLAGEASLEGLALDGRALGAWTSRVEADREDLLLQSLSIESSALRASGRVEVPMSDPSSSSASFQVASLALGELRHWLPQADGLSGEAAGSVQLRRGEWSLAVDVAQPAWGGFAVESARLEARVDAERAVVERLELQAEEGRLTASGRWPFAAGELAKWRWEAQALRLERELAGRPAAATLALRGELTGDPASQRFEGTSSSRLSGLRWAGRDWPDVQVEAELGERGLELRFQEGLVLGALTLGLDERSLGGELRTQPLELEPWWEAAAEPLRLGAGRLELSGTWTEPRAVLVLDAVSLSLRGVPVETREPVVLAWEGSELALRPAALSLADREVTASARFVPGEPAELDARLSGTLDVGELLRSSAGAAHATGELELDLRAQGAPDALSLSGAGRLSRLAWRHPDLPAALEEGSGRLLLEGDRIRLESFEGRLGGGRVTGEGELDWTGGRPGQHRLRLTGEDVGLRAPEGFTGLAGFELRLAGGSDATTLSGEVRLESGRYAKDLHLERNLATSRRRPPSVSAPGPWDRVALDVHVRAVEDLLVRNDLATAELGAELDLRGTAARPRWVGLIEARPGGVVRFQRVRYRLLDGLVSFTPGGGNDPELQVLAETDLRDYRVTLEISGRASAPRVELSSSPELPRERLVALLLSGGAVGAPGGGGAPSAAEVAPGLAQDYLSGRLDPLERRAREALKLDVVEIDPVLVGGADARGARLTLGKALGERLFLTQSVLFGGAGDATTELRLQLTERLSLHEIHEWDGGNSVEARWSRSFGPASRAAAATPAPGEEGPRVRSLVLEGRTEGLDEAMLKEALALGPGASAAPRELRRAGERARRRLVEERWYLARVDCSQLDEGLVSCRVEPGPRLQLEVEGLPKGLRRSVTRAVETRWSELLRGEDPVPAARDAALEELTGRGRLRAQVKAVEGGEPGRVRLIATPGPVVRLGRVEIDGTPALPADELREAARSVTPRGLRAPTATPELAEEAARAVRDLHRARGWLRAEATGRLDLDGDERAALHVEVTAGHRSSLRELDLEGAAAEDASRWRSRIALGEPVRPDRIDALADDIVAELDARGHPDAAVDWVLSAVDESHVDALISVTPGPSVRIGEIVVEGLSRTDESFLRRTLGATRGQPLSREELVQARRRLRATGLFSSAVVRPREGSERASEEGAVRDLIVRVRERDHLDLVLGAGYDSDDGPLGTLSFTNRNLDGRARSTGLHLRLSGRDSRAEGRWHWPRLGGSRWTLLETLRLRFDEEDGIRQRRAGLRTALSRPLAPGVELEWHHLLDRLDADDVTLSIFDAQRDQARLSEIGLGLFLDGRDDAARTSSGRLSSLELRAAASWLGSEVEQLVVEAHHAWWRRLSPRGLVLAGSLRLGVGWPLDGGERLVLAERFRVGGVGSVRGFRPGHAGPLDPVTGDPVGGDAQLVLRNELQIPVGSRWSLLLFTDAGRGHDSVDELFSQPPWWSAGAGFAVDTPAGPLRFVHGFALRAPEGEPGGRFHFTFGSTF